MKYTTLIAFSLALGLVLARPAVCAELQPPIWAGRPDAREIDRRVDLQLAAARRDIAALRTVHGKRTLENTLVPYDRAAEHIHAAAYLANLVLNTNADAATRDRSTAAYVRASAAQTDVQLDPLVYRALSALDLANTDAPTRYYVTRTLLEARLAGVDKDESTRTELRKLNDALTEQVAQFERNIADDQRTVRVAPADLEGMPADYVTRHAPAADGLGAITTSYPDALPVFSFARNNELRLQLAREFNSRGYPKNTEVLAAMLRTRERIANLVGYPTWADYNAADNMVGSGAAIGTFIAEIAITARPAAEREYARLLEEKRRTDPGAAAILGHERSYYAELVRRSAYDFDSQSARPYFAFRAVKQGILDVASSFFGVTFEREQDTPAWDPSVETWRVLDHGRVVGRVYFDLHPRLGKYSHAAMAPVRDGVRGRQLPEAMLVCNFPMPTAGDPALMTIDDVQTFFHEFGHLMHWVLAGQQRWAGISGISAEGDFAEAPSQMLEELIRSPAVLARFARHYATGAPIPGELVTRMNRAAAFGRGLWVEGQNAATAISFEMYRQPAAAVDPDAINLSAAHRYTLIEPVPGTHSWASFGHLAGYSSRYYTYLWDKVIAVDFFQQFDAADPLAGDAPRRYRRLVLEPGGSKSANDLVRDFLGRPQSPAALTRWIGAEFDDTPPGAH